MELGTEMAVDVDGKSPVPGTEKKNKKNRKRKADGNDISMDVGGFTVIADLHSSQNRVVKRILPDWLANPSVVSSNLRDSQYPVSAFNLTPEIKKALELNLINYLFPVQAQVIPWLLDAHSPKLMRPSDICVSAPTGSGKTLAYVLPIVQILRGAAYSQVRAMIILPTEMLASQVSTVCTKYCRGTRLKVFLMTKRLTLTAEKKVLIKQSVNGKLSTPYDIIVATPGRLIDHLENTDGFDISHLRLLVVDEADRTLDDQQANWLQRLETKFWSYHTTDTINPKSLFLNVKSMPLHMKAFHKLLFSATLSQNPETLASLNLFQPKLFTSITDKGGHGTVGSSEHVADSFVGKFTTPDELKESFVLCQKENKPLVLVHLIKKLNWKRVLCFSNTNENTHRLCLLLQFMGNLKVREISSKWSPQTRELVLKKFADGSIDILVTSDQMARGIDIELVDYVISYDLPPYTKTYIHRIGRTARAGREGTALSIISQDQIGAFKRTMKTAGKSIAKLRVRNSDLKPLEDQFKEALAKLKVQIQVETDKEAEKNGKKRKLNNVGLKR